MAGIDYAKLQATVSGLMPKVSQGTVQLVRTARTVDPDKPWTVASETTETYEIQAAVTRVHSRYINGTTIIGTEDQVTFSMPEVEPARTDAFVIDGRKRAIKDLRPIPGAGTPVAYVAIVEA